MIVILRDIIWVIFQWPKVAAKYLKIEMIETNWILEMEILLREITIS